MQFLRSFTGGCPTFWRLLFVYVTSLLLLSTTQRGFISENFYKSYCFKFVKLVYVRISWLIKLNCLLIRRLYTFYLAGEGVVRWIFDSNSLTILKRKRRLSCWASIGTTCMVCASSLAAVDSFSA